MASSSRSRRSASEETEGSPSHQRQRSGSSGSQSSSDNSQEMWCSQYHQERIEAQRELDETIKNHNRDELDWDEQRKLFCDAITAISDENNRLKEAAKMAEDKVKAVVVTTIERLKNINDRIDQVTREAVHQGVMLGLAAMSSRTGVDYSNQPVGFANDQLPHEVEDLEQRLLHYDVYGIVLSWQTDPQSVIDKLFQQ